VIHEDHLNDLVEQWHRDKPDVPLHTFLGMGMGQYATWVAGQPQREVHPLIDLQYKGKAIRPRPGSRGEITRLLYKVICWECGDVTRLESGGTVTDVEMADANIYARQHLAKHLMALAEEINKFRPLDPGP